MIEIIAKKYNGEQNFEEIIIIKDNVRLVLDEKESEMLLDTLKGKKGVFSTLKKGEYQTYNTIQIPITVPCLHEISDYLNSSRNRDIFNEFFNNLKPGINVWCIHDYYEGVLKKNLFESIIREIRSKGVQVIPLSEVLSYYRADEIKTAQLSKRKLPGGRGEISWLEIV